MPRQKRNLFYLVQKKFKTRRLSRDSSLTAVNEFDKTSLKPAETAEKNLLPSSKDIEQEMEHIKFKVGIEKFDKSRLSHADTLVKNVLPTQEIIALEKSQ